MRHLLGLKDAKREEIEEILTLAARMKERLAAGDKKGSELSGKTVLTLFFENSTRTRVSFELAAKYLGAHTVGVSSAGSSAAKGESLVDTVKTLDAMAADVIVARHASSGAARLISRYTRAAVVNAGDGLNEHPTQALLDMLTLRESKGTIDGMKVAIVGDILHSRVARSNIYALNTMGARVYLAGPTTLVPQEFERFGATVCKTVGDAISGADAVMCLRIQSERQKSGAFPSAEEYSKFWGVDEERLRLADSKAILLHPGPVNRGVELTAEAADCSQSHIVRQVTNGVAVRMAVLTLLADMAGRD